MKKKQLFTEKSLKSYYERNDVHGLSRSEKNKWFESRLTCKIEFFKDGMSLGAFQCPSGSPSDMRHTIASFNGIDDYDKYVLDDGRIIMFIKDKRDYMSQCRTDPGNIECRTYTERLVPFTEEDWAWLKNAKDGDTFPLKLQSREIKL